MTLCENMGSTLGWASSARSTGINGRCTNRYRGLALAAMESGPASAAADGTSSAIGRAFRLLQLRSRTMNELIQIGPISPLRQRLLDDMAMRRFGPETQRNYLRDVGRFATWLGRSPPTASAEEVRQFQIDQQKRALRCRRTTAQTVRTEERR